MRTVGLLFPATETSASLKAGGITVLERQARQLRRAGATVLFAINVEPLTDLPAGVEALNAIALATRITASDRVAAIAAGLIVDERAIDAVLEAPAPALLVSIASRPDAVSIERIDSDSLAAGVMVLPGRLVIDQVLKLGEWDLASTLISGHCCRSGNPPHRFSCTATLCTLAAA